MVSVGQGDGAALRALMDRHLRPVLNFIRWYTCDRDWAEALAQDVFVTLYRGADAFEPGRKFVPWLFALARNRAINFVRRRRYEAEAIRVRGEDARPAIDRLEERERAELARLAIEELPEKLRAPLVLCHLQGLSYEDASRALSCSMKTLSSRLSRARERLRSILERYARL